MADALALLHMTPETAPQGLLVRVRKEPDASLRLDEQVAVRAAFELELHRPDYILFRRFGDVRSSQVAAYVVDLSLESRSDGDISEMHRHVWLSGATPLLYVGGQSKVDIYPCARGARKQANGLWNSVAETTVDIQEALRAEKAARFSAFRLVDGTFWEDERNTEIASPSRAAHKALIQKVKDVDDQLKGAERPAARRLLLLSLLLKYLEDRDVFPEGWFATFHHDAESCMHVFERGGKTAFLQMLCALKEKFNGDIFSLDDDIEAQINDALLQKLAMLVNARLDARTGQYYLWDMFSFKHIPVEVLSHIYQHFSDRSKGAIFTPAMLVHLMLDQAMPLDKLRGDEIVLDPTCGSGVFLVAAFRRLIYARLAKEHWRRPTPVELKTWLSQSIFGIEMQPEAASVAAFSLALAICDALRPQVIWKELRFDELLGRNLFVGDYCAHIDAAKRRTPQGTGFDVIIGNPPFQATLDSEMGKRTAGWACAVPNKQKAFFFLHDCASAALAPEGALCMLQNSAFLYSEGAQEFRKHMFTSYCIEGIFDFVSVRGMFTNADIKVVVVFAKKKKPSPEHSIQHWTFRRALATERRVGFELDYYDYHTVPQSLAVEYPWIWKVNLLGGGRLWRLAEHMKEMPTLQDYIHGKKWSVEAGFQKGNQGVEPKGWQLEGMPLLPTEAFSGDSIDTNSLSRVQSRRFYRPKTEERFTPPLLLIKAHESLPCGFWNQGPLAYKDQIVGIHAPPREAEGLQQLHQMIVANKRRLRAICLLYSSRLLIDKATALYKADIYDLPWPQDGRWKMAPWEDILLGEILDYMSDYIRLGQDSELLLRAASAQDMENYTATFLEQMRHVYPAMEDAGHGRSGGLVFQAFRFKDAPPVDWLQGDWADSFRAQLYQNQGEAEAIQSIRLLRIYDGEVLVFVKPDRLRYWIRSVAIRDVDDVLSDIMREGRVHA